MTIPSSGANKVDVAAAGRFIAAAIPRAQRLAVETAEDTASTAESSRTSTPAPVEVHEVGKSSRFKMAHDAQPEKLVVEAEDAMNVVEEPVAKVEEAVSRLGFTNRCCTSFPFPACIETERQTGCS